jgi:hypothetical protein
MENKICSKCKLEKPLEDFLWKNKSKGIRQYQCRECFKEIRKKSYESNREYYLNKNVKKKKQNRDWYLEYKKDKSCLLCGESESVCLDFHHRDETEKYTEISKMRYSTYSLKKIIEEIDKCVILCSNCHRKVHSGLIIIP